MAKLIILLLMSSLGISAEHCKVPTWTECRGSVSGSEVPSLESFVCDGQLTYQIVPAQEGECGFPYPSTECRANYKDWTCNKVETQMLSVEL